MGARSVLSGMHSGTRAARRLVAAAALVVSVAACSSAGGSAQPSDLNDQTGSGPYQGTGEQPALPRPNFTLTDTTGAPYAFGTRTAGRTTLLFFGYTDCPDICPATMAYMGNAVRSLPAAQQRKVTVVFVTTDVKHDTGPVIAKYLKNFSPGSTATFVGLRGTQAQIDAAEAATHIPLATDGGTTHSTQVLLYGPDNYAHVTYLYNARSEQKQMEHDLPLVMSS